MVSRRLLLLAGPLGLLGHPRKIIGATADEINYGRRASGQLIASHSAYLIG